MDTFGLRAAKTRRTAAALCAVSLGLLLQACSTDSRETLPAGDALYQSQHPVGKAFQTRLLGFDGPVTAVFSGEHAFVGDIAIGRLEGQQLIAPDKQVLHDLSQNALSTQGTGIINASGQKWPGGVIPYVFSGSVSAETRGEFLAAKADYDAKTQIRFVPRSNQRDYVNVISVEGRCYSYVGRIGGAQDLSLGSACNVNSARHEMGHALGLSHEQVRQDRDRWVTLNVGGSQNAIKNGDAGVPIGPYDFQSMMHYRNYFRDGRWDYVPKTGFPPERVGNDEINSFTQGDLAAIAAIYSYNPGGGGTPNPPPTGGGGAGTGVSLTKGNWVSFKVRTTGFANRFLRHRTSQSFTDVVSGNSDTTTKQDASFRVVAALDGTPCYSFESRNYPNHFLRHSKFRLRNDRFDGSDTFRKDATFCAQKGLANGAGVSLVSRNLSGYYIRHYDSEVWLAKRGGSLRTDNATKFNDDVSWDVVGAWAP